MSTFCFVFNGRLPGYLPSHLERPTADTSLLTKYHVPASLENKMVLLFLYKKQELPNTTTTHWFLPMSGRCTKTIL
jgi:hypothetical protein